MKRTDTETHVLGGRSKDLATDVRETDNVIGRIRKPEGDRDFDAIRIWRISPLGVEVLQESEVGADLVIGDQVELQIVVEGRRSEMPGLVVSVQPFEREASLLSIRYLSSASEKGLESFGDHRAARRWICSQLHLPRAMAPSPGRFNEFIDFQVRNISKTGLLLVTNIGNSFLVPDMKLVLSVSLPLVGDTIIECEIVRLSISTEGAKNILEIGARMVNLSPKARSLLGQYLLQFASDISIEALIEAGFAPSNIAQGIEFSSLKTRDEYDQLIRFRAVADGRSSDGYERYVHERDRHCRILLGKIGEAVVVAARVAFPELSDRLICEDALEWGRALPRPNQLIEVDGVVANVGDRYKQDCYLALFRYICTAFASEQRPNVLIYTSQRKLFGSIGWKEIADMQGQAVMIGNAMDALVGKKINPFRWNYVWRRSALFMLKTGVLAPTGSPKILLKIYLALGPISSAYYGFRRLLSRIL